MSKKIYVASSWRNPWQPAVVEILRSDLHDVYDFRHPEPGNRGFAWSEIDPAWQTWSAPRFREGLHHALAEAGFARDVTALRKCDVCLLVLPAGRSAHLELGYAAGAGKCTAVLFPHGVRGSEGQDFTEPLEPELMLKLADYVLVDANDLFAFSRNLERWMMSR